MNKKLVTAFAACAVVGSFCTLGDVAAQWHSDPPAVHQRIHPSSCETLALTTMNTLRNDASRVTTPTNADALISCPVPSTDSYPATAATSYTVYFWKYTATQASAQACYAISGTDPATGLPYARDFESCAPKASSANTGTGQAFISGPLATGSSSIFNVLPCDNAGKCAYTFPQIEIVLPKTNLTNPPLTNVLHGVEVSYVGGTAWTDANTTDAWNHFQTVSGTGCEVISGAGATRSANARIVSPTGNSLMLSCPFESTSLLPSSNVNGIWVYAYKNSTATGTNAYLRARACYALGGGISATGESCSGTIATTTGTATQMIAHIDYTWASGLRVFPPSCEAQAGTCNSYARLEVFLPANASLHGALLAYQ